MVTLDSADVWARQDEFILSASVGTPPDAFSKDGQNWGLPPYRWDALWKDDFEWLRLRARRSADLYDGFRVDHLVGFYRTYIRPLDGATPYFHPPDESAQRALGERLLVLFAAAGATIMVEDLGTVPDFVRDSIARAGVPGYRVLRWEREHNVRGRPFIDPVAYPPVSVATTGTHDTETLAVWWDGLPPAIRRAVGEVPSVRARHPDLGTGPFSPGVRDALLEAMFASGSNVLVLPIQDVFGSRDRINEPATAGGHNWTYLLPQPVDVMTSEDESLERAEALGAWTERYGRANDQ
jgi:4-alpha-glucanotransferase